MLLKSVVCSEKSFRMLKILFYLYCFKANMDKLFQYFMLIYTNRYKWNILHTKENIITCAIKRIFAKEN